MAQNSFDIPIFIVYSDFNLKLNGGKCMKLYKCKTCGRTEKSKNGPPKCFCGLPNHINIMVPVKGDLTELNEYLTED